MSKRKEIPNVMSQLQGLGEVLPPPEEEVPDQTLQLPPQNRQGSKRRSGKNKTPKSRLTGRVTYDIGAELKNVIHQESIELGVPASQLAKYLLLYAWDFYVNEDIPAPSLSRSNSPKFRNIIDFAE